MDVGFDFRGATDKHLGKPDPSVSMGQIAVQRQRPFTFSYFLSCAVGQNFG